MSLTATAKNGNGGGKGGPRERCPRGSRLCGVAAVVDLGTQMESFGAEPAKPKHKVALVFEVLDKHRADGSPFVFAEAFTLSVGDKATLRKIVEACGFLKPSAGFDVRKLLGKTIRLKVEHSDNGKQGEERREYANVMSYDSPLDNELMADGQTAPLKNVPFVYEIESGDYYEADWIPWIWNGSPRQRMSLGDAIALSQEKQRAGGAKPAPASAGNDDDIAY